MQVTFLGTGTSQGVPMIHQPPGLIDLNDGRNWRTRTSVHVEVDGFRVQVDAAPEFRLQCITCDIPSIDMFILTHGHADHVLGMDDLRRFCDLRGGEAMPVYSTDEGLARIRSIFPYAVRDKAAVKGYPAFQLHNMPSCFENEVVRIQSFSLPHGPLDVLGLVFTERSTGKNFAYFTDCHELTPPALEAAAGCNLLVLDGLRENPHPSHMTIEEARLNAERVNPGMTYFVHMASTVDHARTEAGLPSSVRLAFDGLTVRI